MKYKDLFKFVNEVSITSKTSRRTYKDPYGNITIKTQLYL